MGKKFLAVAVCCAAVVAAFAMSGCKSKPENEDLRPVPEASNDPGYADAAGGFGGGSGYGQGGAAADAAAGKWVDGDAAAGAANADADGWVPADPGHNLGFPVIYFAFNSDTLVPSETAKLDRIAQYLADKNDLGLLIEGHCDQRGTEEYNRALGERRANAIRTYLTGCGIASNRVKTISFGEDRPAVEGSGEAVWSQNRRGVPVPHYMR